MKASAMTLLLDTSHCWKSETVAGGHDEYATNASGLLALMQQFSMHFGLKLYIELS